MILIFICIGIYYDDPEAVAPSDLRYAVGVILASGSEQPDSKEMELLVSHGYKIINFPKPNFVVMATFPFNTTLSIYMGIFRVYPKLKEYIASRGLCAYPALEIYTSKCIDFIMPLSKQEDFFVPEFCEEQVSIATTEYSNHPDQDDDQKSIKDDDDKIFVRPANPVPLQKEENEETVNESDGKNVSFNSCVDIVTTYVYGQSYEKSISAGSRANFGIMIGVHPSTLQIKNKISPYSLNLGFNLYLYLQTGSKLPYMLPMVC